MIRRILAGLINFFVGLAVLFLGLRIVLRLFGANTDVPFVQWIYSSSGVLLEPFRGIFPTTVITPDHVLDFSALLALVIYALLGTLVLWLIHYLTPRSYPIDRDR